MLNALAFMRRVLKECEDKPLIIIVSELRTVFFGCHPLKFTNSLNGGPVKLEL